MATIANFAVKRGCHSAIPLIAVPRKIPALGAAIVPTHPNWLSGDLDDQQGAQCLRDPATASRVAEQVQIPDLQPSQIAISGGRLDGQDCLPSLLQFFDVDADNDEVEIVPNFAFDFERLEPCSPSVLHRGIRPPTPRSEATVCVVTWGNIAEPAATAFVALLIALLSVRTIGYSGEQCSGGEGVSQSPLKDKAFLIFLGQDPPFELRPKTGVSPNPFMESIVAHPSAGPTLQFPSAADSRVGWRLPSEGKGHTFESCRVRQFFLILQRDMRARTETRNLPRSSE